MIMSDPAMVGQLKWLTVRGGEGTYLAVQPEVDWPQPVHERSRDGCPVLQPIDRWRAGGEKLLTKRQVGGGILVIIVA